MKKEPDYTKIMIAGAIISDIEAERDLEEAENEARIAALEEEIARLKGGSLHQQSARQTTINHRKQVASDKKKAAKGRQTAIFIIMLVQALFYIGLAVYLITHY